MKESYLLEGKLVELTIKSCAPYAKGWQINSIIDGVESEMTFYCGYTKADSIYQAKKIIARDGKLPHKPYRRENS